MTYLKYVTVTSAGPVIRVLLYGSRHTRKPSPAAAWDRNASRTLGQFRPPGGGSAGAFGGR